ncbi:MAG: isochorismatase family protein [Chloroflexi bacterium]|nr:isochorismatase family protein [Chloroflexota bacterium]
MPAPVAVTLNPSNSAFLVLDITSANCQQRPACVTSLPAIAGLLKKARDASATVIYSSITTPGATILPEVAPQSGEQTVTAAADKFNGTNLDALLKQKNIANLVMVGTSGNGAVLYTSYDANLRGYNVVVAQDGVSSAAPFDNFLSLYQLLQQPGAANADNKPLAQKAVTLSRSDLVTFSASAPLTPPSASASASGAAGVSSGASAAGSPGASSTSSTAPASASTSSGSAGSSATSSAGTLSVPAIPAPAAVSLDAKTAALLVLDFNTTVCKNIPACMSSLPAETALIKKARDAKVPVVYSDVPANSSLLPDVGAQPDDPVVKTLADKFFNTNLQDILKQKGATTLIVTGVVANGAVLYTSFDANTKGFTVVVPTDGISSRTPFDTVLAEYQLLHQPGSTNADNKPLADKSVTLSRGDQISFK